MVHLYILDVYIVCEVYTLSVRIVWCIFCVFYLHREFLYAPEALFSMFYPKIEHLFKKRYTVISQICETKFIILPYFLFNLNTLIFYDTLVQLFCEKLPRIRRKKASLFNSKCLWVTCQRVENKGFTNSQTKVYCINKNFVQLKHPYFFYDTLVQTASDFMKDMKKRSFVCFEDSGFHEFAKPNGILVQKLIKVCQRFSCENFISQTSHMEIIIFQGLHVENSHKNKLPLQHHFKKMLKKDPLFYAHLIFQILIRQNALAKKFVKGNWYFLYNALENLFSWSWGWRGFE